MACVVLPERIDDLARRAHQLKLRAGLVKPCVSTRESKHPAQRTQLLGVNEAAPAIDRVVAVAGDGHGRLHRRQRGLRALQDESGA